MADGGTKVCGICREKAGIRRMKFIFGRQYSTFRERKDTTSGPLVNSVDCSEINVTVMLQITGE